MHISLTLTFTKFAPCSTSVAMHQCVLIVTGELLFSQNCYGRLFSVYNHSIHPTSLSPSLSHTLSIPPLSRSCRCSLSHSLSLSISGSLKPFTPFFTLLYYVICMILSLSLSLFSILFSVTGISHPLVCIISRLSFLLLFLFPNYVSLSVSLS